MFFYRNVGTRSSLKFWTLFLATLLLLFSSPIMQEVRAEFFLWWRKVLLLVFKFSSNPFCCFSMSWIFEFSYFFRCSFLCSWEIHLSNAQAFFWPCKSVLTTREHSRSPGSDSLFVKPLSYTRGSKKEALCKGLAIFRFLFWREEGVYG